MWPTHPTLHNFAVVFKQEHYYLHHFWQQLLNSLVVAVATSVITCWLRPRRAFAISRLKVKGGRTIMNLALFTHFIPAAFLAVPMYKTMGNYGLLNNQWALILAMVTIAAPYSIWVLKQASDKLPYELDEAAMMDGASPLQLFRLDESSADGAGTGGGRDPRAAAGVERISLRVPVAVEKDTAVTLPVGLGNFAADGIAVGGADDDRTGSMRCRQRRSTTSLGGIWCPD